MRIRRKVFNLWHGLRPTILLQIISPIYQGVATDCLRIYFWQFNLRWSTCVPSHQCTMWRPIAKQAKASIYLVKENHRFLYHLASNIRNWKIRCAKLKIKSNVTDGGYHSLQVGDKLHRNTHFCRIARLLTDISIHSFSWTIRSTQTTSESITSMLSGLITTNSP